MRFKRGLDNLLSAWNITILCAFRGSEDTSGNQWQMKAVPKVMKMLDTRHF